MAQPDPNTLQAHSAGTDNSFSGAIVALLRALGTTLGPKPAVNPGGVLSAQEAAINGGQDPNTGRQVPPLLQQVQARTSLGNQSPGLGQSF